MTTGEGESAAVDRALREAREVFSIWTAGRVVVWPITAAAISMIVGRHPGCDIVVTDPSVSRLHAELSRRGPGWMLTDLGSLAGLAVEGRRVTVHTMRPAEGVGLGDAQLRWWPHEPSQPTVAAATVSLFSPAQLRVLDAAAAVAARLGDAGAVKAVDIAGELVVSPHTVRTHLGELAGLLDVRGRARGERIPAILQAARSRGWHGISPPRDELRR